MCVFVFVVLKPYLKTTNLKVIIYMHDLFLKNTISAGKKLLLQFIMGHLYNLPRQTLAC